MECELCDSKDIELIHYGTRDNPNINVYRCNRCGLKFLSEKIVEEEEDFYEKGGMHSFSIQVEDILLQTEPDDIRRANDIKDYIMGKKVLDFGCGCGGGIKQLLKFADTVSGVEVGNAEFHYLKSQGMEIYRNIDGYPKKNFDVITAFHVVEHLPKPKVLLEVLKEYLKEGGMLIMETPNAEDALLELYKCDAFADFTYWSPHVFLYNQSNISILAEKSGYDVVLTKQIQRYPLSNHLYWLSNKTPGGHVKWKMINDDKLDEDYFRKLESLGYCDTLITIWKPKQEMD